MFARMEPVSGVMRVWNDGCRYGDPYEWCCTVRYLTRDSIELLAYNTRITKTIYLALRRECQRLGVRKVLRVKYVEGTRKEKTTHIPVPIPKDEYHARPPASNQAMVRVQNILGECTDCPDHHGHTPGEQRTAD